MNGIENRGKISYLVGWGRYSGVVVSMTENLIISYTFDGQPGRYTPSCKNKTK